MCARIVAGRVEQERTHRSAPYAVDKARAGVAIIRRAFAHRQHD